MDATLLARSDLVAMLPSLAVLIAFIVVAGCCIYISYRVGQVVSPTSRKLQERMSLLEAAIARSAGDVSESLQRHREESGKEATRLIDDSARAVDTQAQFVRRGLDDFADRLNVVRLDLTRDAARIREEIQGALEHLRSSAREDSRELAGMQSETLGNITGQIRELGSASERRQERAMATLDAIGADLKAIYTASASELCQRITAELADFRAAVAQLAQTIAGQGAQLAGVERTVVGAMQESAGKQAALSTAIEAKQVDLNAAMAGKQDALNAAIASQFSKFCDETSGQLVQLLASDDRLEGSWERVKGDFDTITRSLVQISRAIDVLKNELTVKLEDGGESTAVDGLFERVLQPNEFERDVEIEPGTSQRVAFAVRLSDNPSTCVWLPVGTLPVVQGYNEFVAATVYNDIKSIRSSSEAFDRAILAAAQDLSSRFVCPPRTLNLAVLLAPTNDLFEEIARRDALVDTVRRSYHVMIAGPTTLPTLLTGLRMAFRGTSATTPNRSNGPLGAA
jgi:DNA recombination protein RmuC